MRPYVVLRFTGLVLLLNSAFLLVSSLVSALGSGEAFFPLLYGAVISGLFGILPQIYIPHVKEVTNAEGLIIVVAGWLLSCLVGILPYVLWGGEFDFTNAWFESVSGFTTTGSTVLRDIEALPLGLLFWRSCTHWIGGIGIIVLVLAVLPYLGLSELALYRTEISAFTREKLNFRTRKAIRILLIVYVGLTLCETLLLLLCGLNIFDAVTHSFATIATGGFSPKNASLAHYGSLSVEIVVMIFMVLSGMHFALLFACVMGKMDPLRSSTVVRAYLLMMLLGVLLCTVNLHGALNEPWGEAFRLSAFQIVSMGTSTGFATTDSSIWPPLAQLLLIFFTLQCACAGSTSGGIKVDRVVYLAKSIVRMIKKIPYPSAVMTIRMDGTAVDQQIVDTGILYISVYLLVVFCSTLVLAALNVDLLSSFTASAACMGNVGPGLGTVGSVGNYSHIPLAGKWVLSLTMILGRLEIYGLLFLFIPRAWK